MDRNALPPRGRVLAAALATDPWRQFRRALRRLPFGSKAALVAPPAANANIPAVVYTGRGKGRAALVQALATYLGVVVETVEDLSPEAHASRQGTLKHACGYVDGRAALALGAAHGARARIHAYSEGTKTAWTWVVEVRGVLPGLVGQQLVEAGFVRESRQRWRLEVSHGG